MENELKTSQQDGEVVAKATDAGAASDKKRKLKKYGTVLAALAFGVIGTYTLLASKAATPGVLHENLYATSLGTGQTLPTDGELVDNSINPTYRLVMQNDGNLVIYKGQLTLRAIWSSHTADSGSNNHLVLQADGNLVVYTAANKAVWSSHTRGQRLTTYGNDTLKMQGDGNLVMYSQIDLYSNGTQAIWSSKTGVIKLHRYPTSLATGQTLSTGQTMGSSILKPAYRLVMQNDGNLVAYRGPKAIWNTDTAGSGAHNRLVLQNDGNLVVYTSANKAVWSTGTKNPNPSMKVYELTFLPRQKYLVLYANFEGQSSRLRELHGGTWAWTNQLGRIPPY